MRNTSGGSSGSWDVKLNESGLNPLRLSVSPLNSSPVTSDDMYLGLDYASAPPLRYSHNGGSTWSSPTNFGNTTSVTDIAPYPVSGSRSQHVWACGLDPDYGDHREMGEHENPPNISADAIYCGVWRSTDRGNNWTQKEMGDFNCTAIAIADISPNVPLIYVATGNKIYRSDEGSNWTELTNYRTIANAYPVALRVGNSNYVYAASDHGIHYSTNSGANWTERNGTGSNVIPSADQNILALTMAHDNKDIMYATTENNVYKTTDAGANWSAVSSGLGRMPISSLVALKNQSNTWSVSESYSL
ncbi:MAG TPA: hypothetical protein VJ508_18420, partial [Saprospiraceae bacterium]|nr:hypothetical protein [Saprospiraceae bacterium]